MNMNDDILTPDRWDLDFYKPEDIVGRDPQAQWVKRSAAVAANNAAKSFYAKTGKRININSDGAYRRGTRVSWDNPGAKRSRHLSGDAFDFQVQDLSDEEREAFLGHLQEQGFKGFGFYTPEQGGHLHADFGNARTWGSVPVWAAKRLKGDPSIDQTPIPYEVQTAVDEMVKLHNIDRRTAYAIAYAESSYTSNKRVGTSSAAGLYQMTDGNWQYLTGKYANKHPEITSWDRDNPRHNALMMGYSIKENMDVLRKRLGRDPTPGEIYGAHFLGATGFPRMVGYARNNPNGYAYEGASEAAVKANRAVFFHKDGRPKTVAEFMSWTDAKAWKAPGFDAIDVKNKSLISFVKGRPVEPVQNPLPPEAPSAGPITNVAKSAGEAAPAENRANGMVAEARAKTVTPNTASGVGYTPVTREDIYVPPVTTSMSASKAAEVRMQHAEDTVGLSTYVADAFKTTNIIPWLYRGTPELAPDPNYIVREEEAQALVDGIDPRYHGFVIGQLSEAAALRARETALDMMESEARLAELGIAGIGLQFVAAAADPVSTIAAAAGVGVGAKMSQFANIGGKFRAALMGGTASVAATGALQLSGDPRITAQDYVVSGLAGMGLGALMGKSKALETENVELAKGFAAAMDQRMAEVQSELAGAGAALNPDAKYVAPNMNAAIAQLEANTVPELAFKNVPTIGAVESLMKSPNPAARLFGSYLGENAIGTKGFKVMPVAASERAKRLETSNLARFAQSYQQGFGEYVKEHGGNKFTSLQLIGKFNDEIGRYIRTRDPAAAEMFSPAVKKVAQEQRKLQKRLLTLAKNPGEEMGKQMTGLKAANAVDFDDHYLYRVWDNEKLQQLSTQDLEGLLRAAIRDAQPDIDEKLVRRMAAGAAEGMKKRAHGWDDTLHRFMDFDEDALRAVLNDAGMKGEELEDALKLLTKAQPEGEKGTISRMKRRIMLTESKKFLVNGREMSVEDYLVNDAVSLFTAYNRQMSGRIAMAQTQIFDPKTGEVILDGIRSDADFEKVIEQVWARGASDGVSVAQIKKDEDDLRFLYDFTTGRLQVQQGAYADTLRLIRKFNFTRVMNQVGFAQIPEMAVTIGQAGWKAALSHMPALRRLVNMRPEDIKAYGVLDEFEAFTGVSTAMTRNWLLSRVDDEASNSLRSFERGTAMAKTENVLENMQRVTSTFSGMSGVTDMIQNWNMNVVGQRFVDIAYGANRKNGQLTAGTKNWLSSLGIDADTKVKYRYKNPEHKAIDMVAWRKELAAAKELRLRAALAKMDPKDKVIYERWKHQLDRITKNADIIPENMQDKVELIVKNMDDLLKKNGYITPKPPKMPDTTPWIEGEATMLDRIVDQIQKHAKLEQGLLTDKKLRVMDFNSWTDLEAREAFLGSLYRASRRMVQENDVGQMRRWMSDPTWATVIQFRNFVISAYGKQLLHNIHMARGGDAESLMRAFTYFTATTVMGGAVYALQEKVRSLGRSDADKYLEERLSPKALIAASFQRAGWSSLIPLAVDSTKLGTALMGEPMFNARSTGQSTDMIFGNPTFGLMDSAAKLVGSTGEMIREGRLPTQSELRNAQQLLPFQNMIGVQQILNAMMSGLEEK